VNDLWAAILPSIVGALLLTGIGLVLRTMVRGLKTYLDDEIRSKLVPNGGQSLADRLTKVESAVKDLKTSYEEQGCLNPNCPERYRCAHSLPAHHKTRRGWFG
jgi:hypothetical protein